MLLRTTLAALTALLMGCGPTGAEPLPGAIANPMSTRSAAMPLETPEDLLAYMVAHPEQVALVAYPAGKPEAGVRHRADALQPLASTVKILVLYEYARQVAEGRLSAEERVSVNDVFAHVVGRDGGAAKHALDDWQARGSLDPEGRLTLDEVARAMIRHSCNASTDYLIARLGRSAMAEVPARLGLKADEAPVPISGVALAMANHTTADSAADRLRRFERMSRAEVAAEAHRWNDRLRSDPGFQEREIQWLTQGGFALPAETQARMCHALFPQGTASGYARIMARVHDGTLPAPIARVMRTHLSWPMALGQNGDTYDAIASKGGSLPGMLTGASYFKRKDREEAMVVALFLQRLPAPVYESLSRSYLQQIFEQKLHRDPAFFEQVRRALAP